jgi:hypothetical protein
MRHKLQPLSETIGKLTLKILRSCTLLDLTEGANKTKIIV